MVKDTDALRHALEHCEQILVSQSELCSFPGLRGFDFHAAT